MDIAIDKSVILHSMMAIVNGTARIARFFLQHTVGDGHDRVFITNLRLSHLRQLGALTSDSDIHQQSTRRFPSLNKGYLVAQHLRLCTVVAQNGLTANGVLTHVSRQSGALSGRGSGVGSSARVDVTGTTPIGRI
jgi:hypothetical protein